MGPAILFLAAAVFAADDAGVALESFRARRTVTVATVREFEAALARAEPGDLIDVAPGEYETARALTVSRGGTAESPVVIRSRGTGAAKIVGRAAFQVRATAYVAIEGFDIAHQDGAAANGKFTGAQALLARDSHHVRFTRNRVHIRETAEAQPHARRLHWIEITGENSHHNRIDRNLVEEKRNGGVMAVVGGSGASSGFRMSQRDRIDHNHFRNFHAARVNGYETIRVGVSTLSHSEGWTEIDGNLFENCDGEAEIVSVKCHRVAVRRNTFLNSRGMLTFRNGNDGVAEDNFFLNPGRKKGTEGIRFFGRGHRVTGNYFEGLAGAAILIRTGDVEARRGGWHETTPAEYGHYLRPEDSAVSGNTIVSCAVGISIGDKRQEYPLAPRRIAISGNLLVGSPVQELSATESFTWKDNRIVDAEPRLSRVDGVLRLPSDAASGGRRPLAPADVGPGAR